MNTYPPLPNNKFTSGHIKVSVYYNTIDRIDRIRTIDRISTIDLFLRHIIRPEKVLEVRFINENVSRSIHYDLEEWKFHSKDPRESGRLAEELEKFSGKYNVYVGVNEREHGGRDAESVLYIRNLFFDLDSKDYNGDKEETLKNAKKLVDFIEENFGEVEYAIIDSGHGYHVYFPFEKINVRENNNGKRWVTFLNKVADEVEKVGVKVDRAIFDLARIMRVPGTLNIKDPEKPVETGFVEWMIGDEDRRKNNAKIRDAILRIKLDEELAIEDEPDEIEENETDEIKDDDTVEREENGQVTKYLCKHFWDVIRSADTAHKDRVDLVARMDLALKEKRLAIDSRIDTIVDFIKKNARWSDYNPKTTRYQIEQIVKHNRGRGYKPRKCEKVKCPYFESCKEKNSWKKIKGVKESRITRGSKELARRLRSKDVKRIKDTLPNGSDDRFVIDLRSVGAGKSTEARNVVKKGCFVFSTRRERDEAVKSDRDMVSILSREEWGCDYFDMIKKSMEDGQRPVSCKFCPMKKDCGYPKYISDKTNKGINKKIAVTKAMFLSPQIQKRNDDFVLDDVPFSDVLIRECRTPEWRIKKSMEVLYGKDGIHQRDMIDVKKDTFKRALNGDKGAIDTCKSFIKEVEEIRGRLLFDAIRDRELGLEIEEPFIPLNLPFLATSFYVTTEEIDGERYYTFMVKDDSPLYKKNKKEVTGQLKPCRIITATPSVEDVTLIKRYYPNAQKLEDKREISKGIELIQITDGAYTKHTLLRREERSLKRLMKKLDIVMKEHEARGVINKTILWSQREVREKAKKIRAKIYEGWRNVRWDHYFEPESKNINFLQEYNNVVIFGVPAISKQRYEKYKHLVYNNFGTEEEAILSEEEYQYLMSENEIEQCIGRMRPYNEGKVGSIVVFSNIDLSSLGTFEKMTLKDLGSRFKKGVKKNLHRYLKEKITYNKRDKTNLRELALNTSAEFDISERSARRIIDKVVLELEKAGEVIKKKDITKRGRGRKPFIILFIDLFKNLLDFLNLYDIDEMVGYSIEKDTAKDPPS